MLNFSSQLTSHWQLVISRSESIYTMDLGKSPFTLPESWFMGTPRCNPTAAPKPFSSTLTSFPPPPSRRKLILFHKLRIFLPVTCLSSAQHLNTWTHHASLQTQRMEDSRAGKHKVVFGGTGERCYQNHSWVNSIYLTYLPTYLPI